jgi:hypothetical protein
MKTNILTLTIFTIIISVIISGCTSESDNTPNIDNLRIKAGQNFGFCIGNCFQEIEITGKTVSLKVINRNTRGSENQDKTSTFTEELSNSEITNLSKLINTEYFNTLEEVYGCPDCADGGSEWIEILSYSENPKKITFEYGKEVKGLENLINLLRDKREPLAKKYIKE